MESEYQNGGRLENFHIIPVKNFAIVENFPLMPRRKQLIDPELSRIQQQSCV